jgi:hypothetical protein
MGTMSLAGNCCRPLSENALEDALTNCAEFCGELIENLRPKGLFAREKNQGEGLLVRGLQFVGSIFRARETIEDFYRLEYGQVKPAPLRETFLSQI